MLFFLSDTKNTQVFWMFKPLFFYTAGKQAIQEKMVNKLNKNFGCGTWLPDTCDRGNKPLLLKDTAETNDQSSPSLESFQKLHLTILKPTIVLINSII